MSQPRSIDCPSCGGEVRVASAAARTAACPSCQNTLIVNEAAIHALGKMALLVETPSCLAVGWGAKCRGRAITVLGRIQYRYEGGLWDEWWVAYDDKEEFAWISQDEGVYTLETPRPPGNDRLPEFSELIPGEATLIGKYRFTVREKDTAEMVGMQGELPIDASPSGSMRYAELASDKHFATLEYFDDGSKQLFQGFRLGHNELIATDGPATEEASEYALVPALNHPAAPAGSTVLGKKVITTSSGLAPAAVSCPSCGGSLTLKGEGQAAVVVCPFCGGAADVTVPGHARLLYKSAQLSLPSPLAIGAQGRLSGVDYTVIGRIRYQEQDDEGTYVWDSFQLFSPGRGFAFLELENGFWYLFRPVHDVLQVDPKYRMVGHTISYGGQSYRVREISRAKIVHVEGELSWAARLGDAVHYLDALRPPWVLSAEWTDKEIEWSLGNLVPRSIVAAALKIPLERMPQEVGVSSAEVFERSRDRLICMFAGGGAAAILLMLAMYAFLTPGTSVVAFTNIRAQDYGSENGFISEPFEVPAGDHIVKLSISTGPMDNRSLDVAVALLDEQEQVVFDAGADLESYSGYEDGEHWSEGSLSSSTLFRLEGPRKYRLNVFATGDGLSMPTGNSLTIELRRDVVPARYFLLGGLATILFPVWEFVRQYYHYKSRRDDDDDDDDDDFDSD